MLKSWSSPVLVRYTWHEVDSLDFLEKRSFTSLNIKIAATCLLKHLYAYRLACSCSDVIIERPFTIVAIFHNAVFSWNWFLKWSIFICWCQSNQYKENGDDFHIQKWNIPLLIFSRLWNSRLFWMAAQKQEKDHKMAYRLFYIIIWKLTLNFNGYSLMIYYIKSLRYII